MKKFCYLTTFILFFTLIIFMSPNSHAFLYGDVNLDGKLLASDARIILRSVVGLDSLDSLQKQVADADRNGTLNAADARKVLRMAVGLEYSQVNYDCMIELMNYANSCLNNSSTNFPSFDKDKWSLQFVNFCIANTKSFKDPKYNKSIKDCSEQVKQLGNTRKI